jgi:hypothetical protein
VTGLFRHDLSLASADASQSAERSISVFRDIILWLAGRPYRRNHSPAPRWRAELVHKEPLHFGYELPNAASVLQGPRLELFHFPKNLLASRSCSSASIAFHPLALVSSHGSSSAQSSLRHLPSSTR